MIRVAIITAALACAAPAQARDNGQWGDGPLAQWYRSLMQPDNPTMSCCGDADAYQADDWTAHSGGSLDATITDARGNAGHKVGETFFVPAAKVKWDAGNPSGHAVLFLSIGGSAVFCFVPGGGV